jgi:hypothetical protein
MAHLIHGKLNEELALSRTPPLGFWRRVRGKGPKGPVYRQDRHKHEMVLVEVSTGSLREELLEAFLRFIDVRVPDPNPATRVVLDYLRLEVFSVHLRKNVLSFDPNGSWYAELTFSGCGGRSEVSAQVCSHWMETWWRLRSDDLQRTFFAPFGFQADERQPPAQFAPRFLPSRSYGYAMRTNLAPPPEDPTWVGPRLLEFDAAVVEKLRDKNMRRRLRQFEDEHAGVLDDGRCRCQLCDPAFLPPPIHADPQIAADQPRPYR